MTLNINIKGCILFGIIIGILFYVMYTNLSKRVDVLEGKLPNEYYSNDQIIPNVTALSSSLPVYNPVDNYASISKPLPTYTPVENVFSHVVRSKENVPTPIEVKQRYTNCISQEGNTIKGCLIDANAGIDNNTCKMLCQTSVNPLSTYCTRVCSELMTSQRNSCASGVC